MSEPETPPNYFGKEEQLARLSFFKEQVRSLKNRCFDPNGNLKSEAYNKDPDLKVQKFSELIFKIEEVARDVNLGISLDSHPKYDTNYIENRINELREYVISLGLLKEGETI